MPSRAPERTSSPLLAQELGRGLGSPLVLSSVFPTRNDPAPGVRGCAVLLEQDTDVSLSIPSRPACSMSEFRLPVSLVVRKSCYKEQERT